MFRGIELNPCGSPEATESAPGLAQPTGTPATVPATVAVAQVLQGIADHVRSMIGVHHALVRIAADDAGTEELEANSRSVHHSAAHLLHVKTALAANGRPSTREHAMDRALANPAQSIETNLSERHHAARASLTSPLVNHRGRQIGIIEVSDKVETDFTPADESNLACFAKIASLAIENACLYHRKADKPSTSVQTRASVSLEMVMGRILAGDAEMRVLLQAGAEAIVRHLGVVLVRVWVSHGGVLELQASAGSSVEHQDQRTRVPVGQFSIGHVARVRRPYVTSCISSDPHLHDKEWAHREGLSAFAGFPLVCGGELLGVLAIYDRKPILPTAFEAVASMSALTAMTILRHRKDDEEIPAVDSITHTLLADFRAEQAVIVTAPNGTIVDWNPAAERSFGYSRPEILGRPIALLVPPDLADEHRNTLAKLADCQTASISETARLCKGGRRINVGLSVSGLRDHSGHLIGAVTVIHDLSEIHPR